MAEIILAAIDQKRASERKRKWSTGLKNRWLAENAFQRRVRKTIIADLLRGLEAARNGAMFNSGFYVGLWNTVLCSGSFKCICGFINRDLLRKIWFSTKSMKCF